MAAEKKKLALLKRIMETDDHATLDSLQAVLDLRSDDWWDSLPARVRESIDLSLEDSRQGRVHGHADVMKTARAWAKK